VPDQILQGVNDRVGPFGQAICRRRIIDSSAHGPGERPHGDIGADSEESGLPEDLSPGPRLRAKRAVEGSIGVAGTATAAVVVRSSMAVVGRPGCGKRGRHGHPRYYSGIGTIVPARCQVVVKASAPVRTGPTPSREMNPRCRGWIMSIE
jgi:hypothetical protein